MTTTITLNKGTVEYKNQKLSDLGKMLNIEIKHSRAHHHETVGIIERNHRTMNEYLRSYLNDQHSDWDDCLKKFTYCYNITPHSSLQLKYTPYELIFGKKPYPLEILNDTNIEPFVQYWWFFNRIIGGNFKFKSQKELRQEYK